MPTSTLSETTPNCPKCQHKMAFKTGLHDDYGFCPECYYFIGVIRSNQLCCKNPNLHFVKHKNRDGRFQLRKQCSSCFSIPIRSYSQKDVQMDCLPQSDRPEEDWNLNFRRMENVKFQQEVMKEFNEKTGYSVDLIYDYKEYLTYLASPNWKIKRKLVLDRDKHICQSCLSTPATQVHHLTYKHLKNEPLFDLVSVCHPCHESITKMSKGENAQLITHTKLLSNILNRRPAESATD